MNIFAVDNNAHIAATMLCDQHVICMAKETAQILCTAAWILTGKETPYKPTHTKHPTVRWVLESSQNWAWLFAHGIYLCDEYTHRFGKKHMSRHALIALQKLDIRNYYDVEKRGDMTPFPQCMPNEYRGEDAVEAYRKYYNQEKAIWARYTNRNPPNWITHNISVRVKRYSVMGLGVIP